MFQGNFCVSIRVLGLEGTVAEALRPMSTGELLDRTFTLYKRNFILFAMIAAPAPALYFVLNIIQLQYLPNSAPSPAQLVRVMSTRVIWTLGASILVWLLGLSIVQPATIRAVSAIHLGRPITIRESYRALRGRFLTLLGIAICWIGILFLAALAGGIVAVIVGLLLGFLVAAIGLPINSVAALIALVPVLLVALVMLLIWSRYALAIQACVVEDLGVFASLKRSKVLAKGSIGKIISVFLVFLVISVGLGFSLGAAFGALVAALHSLRMTQSAGALAGLIVGVLTGPLATVAMSLVYYDERVRKEAFDLQLMMASLDGPQANAAVAAT